MCAWLFCISLYKLDVNHTKSKNQRNLINSFIAFWHSYDKCIQFMEQCKYTPLYACLGSSVQVTQLAQLTFMIIFKWNENVSLSRGFVVLWGPSRVDVFSRCSAESWDWKTRAKGPVWRSSSDIRFCFYLKLFTEASEFSFKLLGLKRSFIFTLIYQPVLNCKSGTYEQRMSLLSAVTLTSDWRDTELYFLKVYRGIG